MSMKAFLFWLMNRNRHWVVDWLLENRYEVETAYDKLISSAIADWPRPKGWITLPFCDKSGRKVGELDASTAAVVEHLDGHRRQLANGRYAFELECHYQWLYRFEPGIEASLCPTRWQSLIAREICESHGSILFIARCMNCKAKEPKVRVITGSHEGIETRWGGVIACECGAVFFSYEDYVHFTIGRSHE